MTREKRRCGFTFLEILFIIGIGALLLVIILPVYSAAKMKGRKTSCLSNLRQIGMSLQLYAQDCDERLPLWLNRRSEPNGKKSRWDSPENIFEAVMVKAKNPHIMYCSFDPYAWRDIEVFGVNHRYSSYYFHMLPPGSPEGTLTITGVDRGGEITEEPAEYLLARDSNIGQSEVVDGRPAYGCQHLGGINAVFLDGHAESLKIASKEVKLLLKKE
jgi:prepilin-type processing-associated H-X9-DG protein